MCSRFGRTQDTPRICQGTSWSSSSGKTLLSWVQPCLERVGCWLGVGEECNLFHSKKGLCDLWSELGPWRQLLSWPEDVLKAFSSGEDQKLEPTAAPGTSRKEGSRVESVVGGE